MATWRTYADWAKKRPATLRVADWLGRGRGRLRWFDHLNLPPRAKRPDLSRWNDHTLACTWIGHATMLMRIGGMTILTDPVMSNKVGIGFGLWTGGPKRYLRPALSIRQLPKLDLILISHAHFDHLDRPTLSRLPKNVPVVTSEHTQDLIRDLGFTSITEMRWGEQHDIGSLRLTAQKVRHWAARTFLDDHRGYTAYVIEAGDRRILYGGDTAYQDYFKSVGKVDLAILGIGAYNPWIQGHANPEQAWEMANHVRADFIFPMHHSTFRLSHEPMTEPMERLLTVAGDQSHRIVAREVGDLWATN